MPEFSPIPSHRYEPVAGGCSIRHPRVVSAEEPHRSGQGRPADPIDVREQDADLARETGTPSRRPTFSCDPQSSLKEGMRDRATGPGDARSGGGAWLASSGPSFMTIE